MKKYIISAFAILALSGAQASPISLKKAAENVRTFLNMPQRKTLSNSSLTMADAGNEAKPYYVFNLGNNNGFVIAAGDDVAYPILGYVTEGHFDVNNIPENMKQWLEDYSTQIKMSNRQNIAATEKAENKTRQNISALVTSKWSQFAPFNLYCPDYSNNGDNCPTGCIAVSVAQIMRYHKWPETSTANIEGYSYNDEGNNSRDIDALPATTFKWNMMTDTYSNTSSNESIKAVAELMKYCGNALKTEYSSSWSGAYFTNITTVLRDVFGYDAGMKMVERNSYESQTAWDDLIYQEIANNRPVIYRGSNSNGNGHVFVCDGYYDGLFHINWGHNGNYNGFFKLNALKMTNNELLSSGFDFSFNQYAIIGITKAKADGKIRVNDVKAAAGESLNVGICLDNYKDNYTSMQFDMVFPEGVTIANKNDKLDVAFAEERSEKGDHNVSANRLKDGSYRLIVVSPSNSRIKGNSGTLVNLILKVDLNTIEGTLKASIKDVKACDTDLVRTNLNNCEFNITVEGKKLCLGDVNSDGMVDEADVQMMNDSIVNGKADSLETALADMDRDGVVDIADLMIVNDVVLQNNGNDRHIISTEINENDNIEIKPMNNGLDVALNNSTIYKAIQMTLTLPKDVKIDDIIADSNRINKFKLTYSMVNEEINMYFLTIYSPEALNIGSGNETIFKIATDVLTVKEAVISDIILVTSDLIKFSISDVNYVVPSGIDHITTCDVLNGIYTVDGIKIMNEDIQTLPKGIYIINGRKVVLK